MTRAKNRKQGDEQPPVIITNADNTNGELHNDELPAPDIDDADDERSITPGAIEAAPPPGANVTHTHQTRWVAAAPNTAQNARGFTPQQYSDAPADPLRDFLDQFNDGEFYTMQVVRDPDPMLKRPPNPTYLRPCYVREILGMGIPLMAQTFIDDLRALNGGSGGNFSVTVYDGAEQFVDAWHGNIGDPIVVTTVNTSTPAAASAPESELDQMIRLMTKQAQMAKLARVIAGVPENGVAPQAAAPVDPELQFAALVMKHADVVGKITGAVSETVANVVKNSGGNDKTTSFADAIKTAIATNPKLQTRLAQTVDRLVDVGARAVGVETGAQIPPNAAPEQDLQTDGDDENAIDADAETDNAEAVLLDFLINECAEGRNVTFQHPVFIAYGEHEPDNYNTLLTGLKMMQAEQLIEVILTRAAEFDRASVYRLVLKRPEGVAWVQHLQASAINSQPLTTETNEHGD